MNIVKVDTAYFNAKRGIREVVDKLTPEENDRLDSLLKQIDSIYDSAVNKHIKNGKEKVN